MLGISGISMHLLNATNNGLHSTQHALSKMPFRYAPFYGILNSACCATEAGVRLKGS